MKILKFALIHLLLLNTQIIYIYIYIYMCVCVYIYIYIYMYLLPLETLLQCLSLEVSYCSHSV